MAENKITHFERVIVISSQRFPRWVGKAGVVLGISEENGRVYGYSVFFPGKAEGLHFRPEELQGTGEIVDRNEFYDEEDVISVRVKNNKGSIV